MPPRGGRQRTPEVESKPLTSLYHHLLEAPPSACLSADSSGELHFKENDSCRACRLSSKQNILPSRAKLIWRTTSGCIHQESCPSFPSRQSRPFSVPSRPQVASFAFLSIDRRCASPYRNLLTEALKCPGLPDGNPRFDDKRTMKATLLRSCFGRTYTGWVLNQSSSAATR